MDTTIPNHIGNVHAYTFTQQSMTALLVNHRALLVHHVIVFQQTFTDTEMVFFHFLLCPLDGVADHLVLNHLSILKSETIHHLGNAFAGKQAHQLVFERHKEHRRTRVTLTSGTATQLPVHTAAFMTFRTDNGQTAGLAHLVTQLDIRTTAGHVGGNRHRAALSCLGHDIRFLLMEFRIQHVVGNLAHLQHLAQHFGNFHRSRTDQYRTPSLDEFLNLFNNRFVFFTLRLIYTVVHVDTSHRTIGRNLHHIKLVNVPKLARLSHSRTCHTGQLVVHAEIVLQRNRGKRLRGSLHLHMFLGFHGLVQPVAPTASIHDTSRLLVHNLHLAINYDIFIVAVEHGISL